jgi:anti-sigma regulatory factor (Ser/Thr protein kinase)
MALRPIVEIHFCARADNLRAVRAAVACAARLAGCSENVVNEIVIAVNEACMNVIQHGYGHDPKGRAILSVLEDRGRRLVFDLHDFAATVDPLQVCPRKLDELRPGGLGVHFIREIMDEFSMGPGRDGCGNLWRMTRAIE